MSTGDAVRRPDVAALAHESADRARQVFELLHRLLRRVRLLEMTAPFEPDPAGGRPVENAGQFRHQLSRQLAVFLAIEALGQHEQDKPAGQRAAGVGEPEQFVREDQKARLQLSRPRRLVFAVDGDRVLAGDRQDPFGNDVLIDAAGKPRVGYDSDPLADQRRESEVRAEPASVGAAQLWAPSIATSIRAMVPLPLRFGPISANAFC